MRLKVGFLSLLMISVFALSVQAQTPQAEVFGGYSFFRLNPGQGASGENVPAGWHASVAGNINEWFGIAGDFSGHYKDIMGVDTSAHSFTFGPRITSRGDENFQPFAHAQFGAARISASALGISVSDTVFAMNLGGGVDIKAGDRFSWRAAQFDYVLTRFGGESQNNFRFSTGIVIRFGSK